MEKPHEKYRRNTWWQDVTGNRKFLLIGIDFLEKPQAYYVDFWEVGKDKSKYLAFNLFHELVEARSLIHFSSEEPYKSYLNE
ncbi:hypothetical protein VB264_05345 [Arcicella aquatica]|uniref:Transposase n=1 Tax=Arcicella aquatica TaxID=217141 RepID=A0ABU5QJF7_9BACT|nr:hypothetical protein [Arcicella aquatica]MEA5257202.1 hypothetical protein [Arcicella aquatica]